jgi:hypothetical protein
MVPLKLVITWRDLGVCLRSVVRVESTGQDSMMSLWTSPTRGMRPRHSLREVPMAGTCVRSIF